MKGFRAACLVLVLGLLLGVRGGYLALWETSNPQTAHVFPCRVEMLPPIDQQALKIGIRVNSSGQLQQLLEDYLS